MNKCKAHKNSIINCNAKAEFMTRSPWRSGEGRRTFFDNCVSQHPSGAGSIPAGSVGRDLNLQKLNYQYLTTSAAVVLVVR